MPVQRQRPAVVQYGVSRRMRARARLENERFSLVYDNEIAAPKHVQPCPATSCVAAPSDGTAAVAQHQISISLQLQRPCLRHTYEHVTQLQTAAGP